METLTWEVHEVYGYIGARKVELMISEIFFARKLRHNVRKILASCDRCQRTKYPNKINNVPAQFILPEKPGDLLSIDFKGPMPLARGQMRYLLVGIDAFSKFVVLYPLRKATTKIIISKIFGDYVSKYGKPRRIQSDQGSQFTSKLWCERLKNEGIEMVLSCVRHPQSNMIEMVNRKIGRFLRTLVTGKHGNWINYVEAIQNCLNVTCHETTQLTPIELHLNIKPNRIWQNYIHIPEALKSELGYE